MEFGDQSQPNIANATFRLDGGFATPEAQQRFEAAVVALGGLIGAEVTIDYGASSAEAPAVASGQLRTAREASDVEARGLAELSGEGLREYYLGMSLETALSEFSDIDEKIRRMATRQLKRHDVETVRDALITGRHHFVADSQIRVSVRNAMEQFITGKLPGTEWHHCPTVRGDINMPFIASVAKDLRDIPAVAIAGFRWHKEALSSERLTVQDLFEMSVDDLTACFARFYDDQVPSARTDEERQAGARAIARVAAQPDATKLRDEIHSFAIDFLHARQQLLSERPGTSMTQPDAEPSF